MNTYQVFIDVAVDGDWNEIEVESLEIDAFNANDAFMKAQREYSHEDFYVWEVTEDDII
tara:strand:- start:1422 stop:1598 length:177 start_codon:yes stop_codon:yes gene_type:complete